MNSKNFLFAAVFVVLSFFAICFVWEARSALRESEVNDVSVGACVTGYRAVNLENACSETPAVACPTNTLINANYRLECGCDVILPIWINGCSCHQSRSRCESSNGKALVIDHEGADRLEESTGSCGSYTIDYHTEERIGDLIYYHINCPNGGANGDYVIKQYICIEDDTKPSTTDSCGSFSTSKGC